MSYCITRLLGLPSRVFQFVLQSKLAQAVTIPISIT
jgi:hypothetical protein